MLTPKEKALELYNKFYDYADSNYGGSKFEQKWHGNVLAGERKVRKESTKQCALIALDLLLYYSESPEAFIEFEEIKKEIELL